MTRLADHKFKGIKHRVLKAKPIWHQFACLGCGINTIEYSDPAASLFLCNTCLRTRLYANAGLEYKPTDLPPQQNAAPDWWSIWCEQYEQEKKLTQMKGGVS